MFWKYACYTTTTFGVCYLLFSVGLLCYPTVAHSVGEGHICGWSTFVDPGVTEALWTLHCFCGRLMVLGGHFDPGVLFVLT
jgi:hypothetical protein